MQADLSYGMKLDATSCRRRLPTRAHVLGSVPQARDQEKAIFVNRSFVSQG